MSRVRWSLVLCSALWLSCAGTAPAVSPAPAASTADPLAPLPAPLSNDPLRVTIHRLSNGLTVYFSPDKAEPRISAHIVVRAGGRTDPADSTGLAHYLEHMLFKGTERLGTLDAAAERPHLEKIEALYDQLFEERDEARRQKLLATIDQETVASSKWLVPNELDQLTTSLGFRGMNAGTSDDWTMYFVEVPSNRLEHWARMEAARLAQPVFRLFLPELEAVYEEKNSSIDSPDERVQETLSRLLYPQHPYGTQPVIGHAEHLKNPAYRKMVEYFRRYYVPGNMAVVLAGDVDPARALPLLEKHFGAWKARPVQVPPAAALPPLAGRTFAAITAEGAEQLTLAWQTVPGGHPDEAALEVMDLLMSDARAGLLNSELVLPQKMPAAVSHPVFLNEAGNWRLMATARDGQPLEEVERLLLETVAKLKAGRFTDEELRAAVLNADIRDKRELEANTARAMKAAEAFVRRQAWADVAARAERLRALGRADILRVANTYLGSNFAVVYRRKGKLERTKLAKPRISPLKMDASRQSPFAKELTALPVTAREPEWLREGVHYQRGKLPAGKLLAARNPRNDLYNLTYRFDLGHRRHALLCHAISVQETAGAGALDAAAFQRKLYALGATVDVSCGADETYITIEGVDEKMEETLGWVARWFREPRFDQADVDRRLATVFTERRNAMDDPMGAASALQAYAERGAESDFLTMPSNAVLARARAEELRRLLAGFLDHQHTTLYFGPKAMAEAAQVIGLGKAHQPVAPRPPYRYAQPERPTILLLDRELAQAQLTVTFPVGVPDRRDMSKSQALSRYIGGGMHSLVFQEIREARGLAYSVDAAHIQGSRPHDHAALMAMLAAQPDKAADAFGRLLELVQKEPVLESRMKMTRALIEERLRSQRHPPRQVPGTVDGWDQLGEPGDPRPRLRQEIAVLGAAELQRFLRQQTRRPFSAALTGEKSRLDLAQLRRYGTVKEVKVDDLFGFGSFPPVSPASPPVSAATAPR